MHLIGVLLAAGRSTRMGQLKQLLPWPADSSDRKTLVAAAFDAIAPACCAMVAVVGHEADAVAAALGERRFDRATVRPGAEMIESVKSGLSAARGLQPTADVLLHPADHPQVAPETIEALLRAVAAQPGRAVLPEYAGQGGHPVLIPAALVDEILAYPGLGGLRQFWLERPRQCHRLAVDDPGVVLDVDTPADYGVQVG